MEAADSAMDWGSRGKPTIADAVLMLAASPDVEETNAWLQFIMKELEPNSVQGGRALLAAETARPANGIAEVIKAMDDFGHPPSDEDDARYGTTNDSKLCATLGCIVLFLATRSHSPSESELVEPTKQAAVDAVGGNLFDILVELLRDYPQSVDVLDPVLHVLDSVTEGATAAAHERKLYALEAGALPAVVETLQAHRGCLEVQEYGLGSLARLVGIDEAYREQLTDAGDATSVTEASLVVSVYPRAVAFDAGAIELARSALRLHSTATSEVRCGFHIGELVACQALTVLANLAMGTDDGARARKQAAQAAMPEVEAALRAWPASTSLRTTALHLQRNLHAVFPAGRNGTQSIVHASGVTEEFVVSGPKNEPERGGATDQATPLPRATSVTASTGSSIAATPLARPPAFIDTPFPSRKEYDAWVAAGSLRGSCNDRPTDGYGLTQ